MREKSAPTSELGFRESESGLESQFNNQMGNWKMLIDDKMA